MARLFVAGTFFAETEQVGRLLSQTGISDIGSISALSEESDALAEFLDMPSAGLLLCVHSSPESAVMRFLDAEGGDLAGLDAFASRWLASAREVAEIRRAFPDHVRVADGTSCLASPRLLTVGVEAWFPSLTAPPGVSHEAQPLDDVLGISVLPKKPALDEAYDLLNAQTDISIAHDREYPSLSARFKQALAQAPLALRRMQAELWSEQAAREVLAGERTALSESNAVLEQTLETAKEAQLEHEALLEQAREDAARLTGELEQVVAKIAQLESARAVAEQRFEAANESVEQLRRANRLLDQELEAAALQSAGKDDALASLTAEYKQVRAHLHAVQVQAANKPMVELASRLRSARSLEAV